jgi:hypothetical protein
MRTCFLVSLLIEAKCQSLWLVLLEIELLYIFFYCDNQSYADSKVWIDTLTGVRVTTTRIRSLIIVAPLFICVVNKTVHGMLSLRDLNLRFTFAADCVYGKLILRSNCWLFVVREICGLKAWISCLAGEIL